ncbi:MULTISPECIES: cytochrome P450 [Bacillaceae]|uniref:cytochrome P450 n=1 Tax=Bacillaceae TaxID=186817 RepID=UPI000E746C00|nr:cytochrome P450 [Bacillus sp. PK3_68]RJS61799.1 cytochrome P450 [Bacillus sp. PK3_68]
MASSRSIPKEKGLDHTLALLAEGYEFIPERRSELQSDIFQTRILGQKAICIAGEEAAAVFYDENLFTRKGAAPKRVQKTLFGEKAIQTMDGEEHKQRKRMFLSMMTPKRLDDLANITKQQWQAKAPEWKQRGEIVLFHEAEEVMCRIACEWAGVPITEVEVKQRAADFGIMIDTFAAVGGRYREGKQARARSEKWIEKVIKQIRSKKLQPPEHTAAYIIAWHRDLNGKMLDDRMAAIELINILRPIVAIGRFVTFGALALHDYPEVREKVKADKDNYSHLFVQEVRRFYPFGPFVGARVREDFKWKDYEFKKGTLVLLDIYGTNHHPDLWDHPEEFRPERFAEWKESPFSFIPQGGGDHYMGHRCAGEWVTVLVMKESLKFLTKNVAYDVPEQDLTYDMSRIPSLPESRFIIKNVQLV